MTQINLNTFDAMANEIMPLMMARSNAFTEWHIEYPGWIALHTTGGAMWAIGTANGVWGADYFEHADDFYDGSPNDSISTGIPADCIDANDIADALFTDMSKA